MTTAQERKQQERNVRRRRIQRAARSVFAERGYAKTSIEAVAKEASLSVGAIYLYFRSKEDLYISLLEDTLELLSAELSDIVEGDAPDKLGRTWKFLCTWAQNDTEATRVLRLCSQPNIRGQLSDEVTESIRRGFENVQGRLAAIVAARGESGDHPGPSAEKLADIIWALFIGLLQASDAKTNFEIGGAQIGELSQTGLALLASSLAAGAWSRAAA
jgi:AcrR family transcriptional regulator